MARKRSSRRYDAKRRVDRRSYDAKRRVDRRSYDAKRRVERKNTQLRSKRRSKFGLTKVVPKIIDKQGILSGDRKKELTNEYFLNEKNADEIARMSEPMRDLVIKLIEDKIIEIVNDKYAPDMIKIVKNIAYKLNREQVVSLLKLKAPQRLNAVALLQAGSDVDKALTATSSEMI